MWKTVTLMLVVVLVVAFSGCREKAAPKAAGAVRVVVTVPPLKGLVEPLLPAGSTVTILMQPGRSEHGYEFTPADVAALADADLVVYVGMGLEGQLESILAKQDVPNRKVISFAGSMEPVGAKPHDHAGHDHAHDDHAHDHDHDHDHGDVNSDPHLWLDPVVVDAFLPSLSAAVLQACTPAGASMEGELPRVEAATKTLRSRVQDVNADWKRRLEPLKGRGIVTHHNAFARPAERYGFKVAAVIRELDADPSPADLAKVIDAIRAEKVGTIFIEPQYSAAAANKIRDMAGVKVATLDPLGDGDWFGMMQKNLDALVAGMSEQTAPAANTP